MKRSWLAVALLFLLCMTQTARAADDTIYAVNFNSPARVLTINPSTGVASNAGTLSFGSAAAAIDPISGYIYYTEYNPFGTSPGRVAYWNPATATNTIINPTGPGFQIPRLAFDSTGTLYGMDASNNLYTIDTDDGEFHLLGTVSGVAVTSGGDLAFSPDGTLYLLAGGTLYTIDTFALSGSSVLNTGISSPTGLAFADNNILYASNLANNAGMYTINLSTGVTTPTSSTAGTLVDDLLSLPKFADLSITKAASSSFIVGTTATYTLTVSNSGPQSAGANIVVRDTLPTGLTYNSYNAPGWTCSASGQVVTCTRNTSLGVGASSMITLTVNVLSTASPSVNNTATVDSPTFDPDTDNNSSTVTTAVTVPPDLRITKTHSGNFFQGQNNATYTLTVTNSGSGPTVGTVTVTDTLPTGLTFASNGGTGWTGACSASGQVVTCTRSTTLNAGASYPALTINVNVSSTAPASVTNSVTVAVNGELVTNNNSATDPTTINGRPDLAIAKSHTGNFTQGQTNAPYTITVSNVGRSATTAAMTVTDTLPAGLSFVSGSGTNWNNCTASGQTVTCTRSTAIAALTSSNITLLVNVSATAPASVTNNVSVSGGGQTYTGNDSASDVTAINQLADLTIAKSHTGNFTQGQANATYTITVTNSGGGDTTSQVTVTDTLPAGLSFVSGTGTGWNNCTASGQTVTCLSNTAIAAGASSAITLTVNVAANAPSSVTNSVAVLGGGEIITNNNSATDPTTINGVPDLTITKSHTGNFTQGQTNAAYTLTVTNSGTGPTNGTVTVTDTLPAGLSFVSGSPAPWSCSASGQVVTCTRSDALAASSSYSALTLTVNVSATAPASVTNNATVSGGGETNTGNNSASDVTNINQLADLTIAKTHTGNFTRGTNGNYTITVTNSGASQTTANVTVTDTLPAGLTPTGWSGAPGWSCNIVSQTVTCTNTNALNAGASYTALSITVSVAQNASASLTNTASVSGGGQVNTANDTSSDPTTIVSSSDLSLTKITNNPGSGVGTDATFTITLTNAGPSDANNVTVRDQLPAGLTYVNSTASSGVYNSSTGIWTLPSVASGASPTLEIVARINTVGALTNSAEVTASDSPDPDSTPNNNNATEDDQASASLSTAPPVIALCKTVQGQNCPPAGPLNMPPGSDITYVITFTNSGGSFATGFVITDPIPANTDFKVGSESHTTPLPAGLTGVTIEYFDASTSTWITNPVSGGGGAPSGYDRNITSIRWTFQGNLSHIAPNNTGYVGFTVRIR